MIAVYFYNISKSYDMDGVRNSERGVYVCLSCVFWSMCIKINILFPNLSLNCHENLLTSIPIISDTR